MIISRHFGHAIELQRATILLVESDPEALLQLKEMLAPCAAQVFIAASAETALSIWQERQPDIILTEIATPMLGGLALCASIQEMDPDAAIVVISPADDIELLKKAISQGVSGYAFKPLDLTLLTDALLKALRERKQSHDLKMAQMVFAVANEGIIVTNGKTQILAVNPAFSAITGYRPDEVVGRKGNVLSSGKHGRDFFRAMWDELHSHGRWEGEITNRRKNGEMLSQWLSIASVESEVARDKRFVGLISDISERKKEEELIRRLAHFDTLTGLPNRALFNDRLQRAIVNARRHRNKLALVYIDLDDFKSINDNHGHAIGDAVLIACGERLLGALRQSDTVSRRGGDEFVAIIDLNGHPDGLAGVCKKLHQAINQKIDLETTQLNISVSMGIAIYPDDAPDEESLLLAADLALYGAKRAGKNRIHHFRKESQHYANDRIDLERELQAGLKDWRYSLRYLPEISLVTGEIENVEALLRFHHPVRGMLNAGQFLEIAENMGIMPELGQLALTEAVKELRELSTVGSLGLVIDLSARQLAEPGAVSHLLATLHNAGVDNCNITFECTETVLTDNEVALQSLIELASSGCKFTLDDFGAGYCSFSLISQLPMTSIKIDRSFVSESDTNPEIQLLVGALLAFGKRLNLRTVAEGTETTSQIRFLQSCGCDAAQGYVFGQPMTSTELQQYIEAKSWLPMIL